MTSTDYKYFAYLIPISIIISGLLTYFTEHVLFIFIGGLSCIMFAFISTQGDQSNPEAFENGLKIPIIGKMFRNFVPYRDIIHICSFNYRFFMGKPMNGLVLIFKKKHRYNLVYKRDYCYHIIIDGSQTPFDTVIPYMKMQIPNWEQIYHPEIKITEVRDLFELYNQWNS